MDIFELGAARLAFVQGDITKAEVDAIVNAANSSLMGGGGVDGAIHRAGGPAILDDCRRIVAAQGRLPAGHAVLTTGGRLPARHVIHTVGPVWHGGQQGEPQTLASCYRESLRVARESSLTSIAFPSISTGAFGYPLELAGPVALGAVRDAVKGGGFEEIRFVLFDDRAYGAYLDAARNFGLKPGQ